MPRITIKKILYIEDDLALAGLLQKLRSFISCMWKRPLQSEQCWKKSDKVKDTPDTATMELRASKALSLNTSEQATSEQIDTAPAPVHSVLIVEDYAPNIMVASMILESLGFEAVTAEDGQAAIACMEKTTVPFTAILMDVQMYDMDGFETTRRIREIEARKGFRNTIIGVTAHALAGDRERCLSAGMDDYMSKPIHPDILSDKLTALLAKEAEKSA